MLSELKLAVLNLHMPFTSGQVIYGWTESVGLQAGAMPCDCICLARCNYKQMMVLRWQHLEVSSACRAWANFSAAAATSLLQCVNSIDHVVFHRATLPEWRFPLWYWLDFRSFATYTGTLQLCMLVTLQLYRVWFYGYTARSETPACSCICIRLSSLSCVMLHFCMLYRQKKRHSWLLQQSWQWYMVGSGKLPLTQRLVLHWPLRWWCFYASWPNTWYCMTYSVTLASWLWQFATDRRVILRQLMAVQRCSFSSCWHCICHRKG